jgi:hypothetical protein
MQIFKEWLNNNPGMAKRLGERIKVAPATISNVKHGRKPMPTRWIPVVVDLSDKQISYEQLVTAKLRTEQ